MEGEEEVTINVLGTEYEIIHTTDRERPELKNVDGYCANYEKYILVETDLFRCDPPDLRSDKAVEERSKQIKRHEIIHAFIMESAAQHSVLDNEYCVHWIALQFPKMLEAFRQVNAI